MEARCGWPSLAIPQATNAWSISAPKRWNGQRSSTARSSRRTRLEALVAECLRTGEAKDYEWRACRPDGEIRHILARNVLVVNDRREAIRMAGTSVDITDRKRTEEEVRVLRGILPICASCKRIKNEGGGWEAVESFVREHTDAEFSHGLCPDCAARDWGNVKTS